MQQSPNATSRLGYGFALTIFIAPFIILPSLSEFANLPQAAWLQVSTFLTLTLFLLNRYRRNEATLHMSPLLLPITALLLWCFVGLSYAVNPYEVIKRLIHLLAAAAAFFLVLQLYSSTDRAKTLLWALSLSGLGVALIGMCQHLFGLSLIPQISPPAATFANKNMAAHFIVLTMPASMMIFLLERKRFAYLLSLMFALQGAYLAYARTRASWLALFIELSFFALFFLRFRKTNPLLQLSTRQKKGLVVGLILFACLIGLGTQGSLNGYQNIVSRIEQSQSYAKEPGRQVRFALWLNTLAMARDHLALGVGLGNFKSYYPLYHNSILKDRSFTVQRQSVDSHNDLLQGIAELGIVGLGLFIWLFLKTLFSVRNSIQEGRQDEQIIAAGASIGLIAFLVIALFSFPMACSMPPFVAALYLGLMAACVLQTKIFSLPPKKILSYGVISCVLCVMVGVMNYKELRADHYLSQFIDLESQQKWPEAILVGQKMVRENPLRQQLITYLGRAYMNTGKLDQAEKSFQIALKTNPVDVNTMTNLGVVYLKSSRYKLAKEISEQALAIFPENWAACSNIGLIYMHQGLYHEAKEYFEKASRMRGESKLVWFNLGEASIRNGDLNTAIKAFEKALVKDPAWLEAEERLLQAKKQKSLH